MAGHESVTDSEELDFDEDEEFESDTQRNRNDKNALALQLARTPDNQETFRPLLADIQKIGFFSLDRACQTTVSEIVEIKELTDTVEQLLEDSAGMRRDINFARSVMQAEFDAKLQKKALELYERVNDKIGELERMHEERVAVVRRAFRQQLADALVRVKSLYHKDADQMIRRERKRKDADTGKWEIKIKELQATVQRNESVIHMLKMQLSQYQEKEEEIASYKSRSTKTPSVHPAEVELEEVKEEVSRLEKQLERLQEALDVKEKDNEYIMKDMEDLTQQLEKERLQVEQLYAEKAAMEESKQADQQTSHKYEQAMEQQRIEFEKQLNDRILQVRQQALEEAKQEAASLQSADAKLIRGLQDEKRLLEQLLAKERAKKNVKTKDQVDLERAKHKEVGMVDEITKLKREIDRVHRTWEKKFAILQQSLHALKDESYLRQTMQKQAAQLHQASISYAAEGPMGVMPLKTAQPQLSAKKPLPHIGKAGKGAESPANDYLSYTVSAPSGRATTLFSTDENQIMSDGEQDLPEDILPLPAPAEREDSRPSTRQHVVVLPHA